MISQSKTQDPRQNPESYTVKKQLLAYLAHVMTKTKRQESLDYDADYFKEAVYKGLHVQTKLAISSLALKRAD